MKTVRMTGGRGIRTDTDNAPAGINTASSLLPWRCILADSGNVRTRMSGPAACRHGIHTGRNGILFASEQIPVFFWSLSNIFFKCTYKVIHIRNTAILGDYLNLHIR